MQTNAMVIEDDKDLSYIFSHALKSARFATEAIMDGERALSRLGETVPSLVVLDLNLPIVSGVEILQHIRNDPRLSKTRVIIATANSHIADTLSGADFVLIKPISYQQLSKLAARLANQVQ